MLLKITNEQDFYLIARNFYNNGQGNTEDQFRQDLRLISSLKSQLKKYQTGSGYDLRLMLNNYIILSNVFGIAVDVMLRFRVPQQLHPYLAVFPVLLKGKLKDPDCFSIDLYNEFKVML